MRLGEFLVHKGEISSAELERALAVQTQSGGLIGTLLVRMGALSEDVLLEALSEHLDYVLFGDGWRPFPDYIDIYKFMRSVPIQFNWFLHHKALLWKDDGQLYCLAKNPNDSHFRETLRYFFREEKPIICLCRAHDLDNTLSYIKREFEVEKVFEGDAIKELRELAEEAPVVELVNNIFSQAIEAGASDIHIEAGEEQFDVRFRIDGVLQSRFKQPMDRFPAVASRIKLISGIDIAERRLPQDGRVSTRIGGGEMDIRVSSVPDVRGESLVLRLLPKEREDLALSNLGMEKDHLDMMSDWSSLSNGIVLVTGPTGSGKSTTLYAALQATNTGSKKIITVEDPVEFQLAGITQIQTHSEIGYSFARALRAILRQDPDVIMIGEIRDTETAEIAVQSALTGHLVLSTLHTNDAISAFTRLIDMGIEPFLVAAPLKGVQAQRLVRKLCTCAEPASPANEIFEAIANIDQTLVKDNWSQAKGCDVCQGTGYKGRIGIYEMVQVCPDIQAAIAENSSLEHMRQLAQSKGYRTLLQDGLTKASKGITSIEEVYRVVSHG